MLTSSCLISFTECEPLEVYNHLKFKGKCWEHTIMRTGTNKKVCQNCFGTETTECFQHKWKADTIHTQLMGQPKENMSAPVNFFPFNYCMTSTLKSIRNTAFLWNVFCGIIFFTMRGLSSHISFTTWICILEAWYWFWISKEITNMIHVLWLIPLKCPNCINYIIQSILQPH